MKLVKHFDSSPGYDLDGKAVLTSAIVASQGASIHPTPKTPPASIGVPHTPRYVYPTIEAPLTAAKLAAIVPLHPVTILRWAREGRIPHRRLSARKIVFLPSEIRAWLASASTHTDPAARAASTKQEAAWTH